MANNLAQATKLIQRAAAAKASALFLPEATDWISSGPEESKKLVRPVQDSEFVRGIQAEARAAKLPISVGVHEPGDGSMTNGVSDRGSGGGGSGDRVKNTLLWIDENGKIAQRYQKLHLFDMEVTGGPNMRESK